MDNVFIGANSTIMYGVRVGSNVIIGSGTIVTKDLESGGVYVGVPARKIGLFDDYMNRRINSDRGVLVEKSQRITKNEARKLWDSFLENNKE